MEKEQREKTRIQILISAVNQNTVTLAAQMNLETDALIVNQCHENSYSE
jgi:hypothetical protein